MECKSNNKFKKFFKDKMPDGKQYKSYPAVKIGRFAVHKDFAGNGFGSQLLDYIKGWFISNNKTGCQYITVDAYAKSSNFYEKNNFIYFTDEDKNKDTRQMYFSLVELFEA
jgi:GNAT superfamily N-acetyltransferase